ncbi:MAG TPA: adenylyltransferase/cytidyltransferase family protein [Thermoplasmata archaeon]|jgi:FAD synthetase|nr:adenylyltransferase/cytidyltransferase family protein [Thermoplasmata archaeon]
MVRVMATGVFDLLHPGHIHYLTEAKKLGDELVVIVARDSTAERFKHRPIVNEEQRLEMVSSLKPVDRAVLGHEGSIFEILDEIRPDVIALGFDQVHDEGKILEECRKRGLPHTKVVRLPKFVGDLDGTRKIIAKVAEYYALRAKLEGVGDAEPKPKRKA